MPKYQKLEELANESKESLEIPEELPAIPVRTNMLVYPGSVMPFYVGRERSLKSLEEAIENKNRLVFLIAQKDPNHEDPGTDDFYEMGVVAQILQVMKLPDNSFKVLVEGLLRAKIVESLPERPFLCLRISFAIPRYRMTKSLDVLIRKVREDTKRYFSMTKKIPPETLQALDEDSDADRFADFVASILPLDLKEKQRLMETIHPKDRLEILLQVLARELELLQIEEKLEQKVRGKIEQNQKEYYLREKMRAIREELDGATDPEIMDWRIKIQQGAYPEYVREKAMTELDRLEKSPAFSAESTVIRTYLDWLLSMPWNSTTEDRIDIALGKKILDGDHYGLEEVKQRILEFLAVRAFSENLKAPILCLVGPPGVGKTSLGMSLARTMNRKFVRMSLGGVRDEAEIRGHRRTYVGSLPGRVLQLIRNAGSSNPLLLFDEIDKMGQSMHGDPAAALLEVLDPEQNHAFVDHFLEVPFDLSKVIFVTTANVLFSIPPALKDRMEVIEIPGYTYREKMEIAKGFLVPKLLNEHGMKKKAAFSDDGIETIIDHYTREAGVRNLQRELASLIRKSALDLLNRKGTRIRINRAKVQKYLGPQKYMRDEKLENPEIGVSTGLAWTAIGGSVLQVEAQVFRGKGTLILTGQLGDVMKESAKIALSISRKYCDPNLSATFFDEHDIHIHVPEGAVPKDGPSAGITMVTALISSLAKIPARNDIAMTGEVTLTGKILPIGGVREKILAAHRVGIYQIILPEDNRKDTAKIPAEIAKKIQIHYVDTVHAVLKTALTRPIENHGHQKD